MNPRRLISALFATALLLSGLGAHAETAAETPSAARPLNLTLPRDAVWSGANRTEAGLSSRDQQGMHLPDPGASQRASGHANRLPYGSGYEARQRGYASDQGMTSGGRGQGRGGHGRGR